MADTPNQPSGSPSNSLSRRPIRWWPVVSILLLAVGMWFWAWRSRTGQRQDLNMATASIGFITALLLLIWWVFLSRSRWKIRLGVLGGVVGTGVLLAALFRIHGVTGDLVPVLQWRWTRVSPGALERRTESRPGAAAPEPTYLTNDFPQFRGPHRNGTLAQPQLARDWNAQPPERLWLRTVGPGWSGFAVAGNRAITQEQRAEQEAVICYDLLSGGPLWSYAYPAHFQSALAGEGPRSTPTVAGHRVYALGATGILNCLDLETGKLQWSKDIAADNQARLNDWGMSCSPLVMDDLVVVSAGGGNNRSLVAYRVASGEFAWGGGSEGAGYSSPFLTTLAGVPQIVMFNSGGVSAHDPSSGTNLWHYPWPSGHPHVATPVVLPGDGLLVSSGYGIGSEVLKIQKDAGGTLSASRVWKSTHLKAKFTDLIYRDGFIYGLDDGTMVCLDAVTGERKWKDGHYGHGQELLAGDLLLVTAESGEVILLDPNPQAARELTRFSALKGKTWNPPALAGQYLVVRNDKEAACYRLPLATR